MAFKALLLATLALSQISSAQPFDIYRSPKLTDAEVCEMSAGNGDTTADRNTWNASGAALLLQTFLTTNGIEKWSHNFLVEYGAMGKQNSTPFSCTDVQSGICGPADDCVTYEPAEAYFVHMQMANLFQAMKKLQTQYMVNALSAISTGIHDIVGTFGVVKDDGSASIFNVLLGIAGSLSGMAGLVNSGAGVPKGVGMVKDALSLFVSVVNAGRNSVQPKTAADVQGEITATYGNMFTSLMGNVNETTEFIFGAPGAKAKRDINVWSVLQTSRIYYYFQDALWLDTDVTNHAMDIYSQNMGNRMLELCLIQAMKDNEFPYIMSILPAQSGGMYQDPTNSDTCGKNKNCLWYDNHCICIEQEVIQGGMFGTQYKAIRDDEVTKLKKYMHSWEGAISNNYECVKKVWKVQDTPVKAPDRGKAPPFDVTKTPSDYFDCFWNLDAIGSMSSK